MGARVNATASDHNNLWAAGAVVAVRGSVKNDIMAAGAELDIDATAGRSLWATGAIVSVAGQSQDMYVWVAGNVEARVGGKLSIAVHASLSSSHRVPGVTSIAGLKSCYRGGRGQPNSTLTLQIKEIAAICVFGASARLDRFGLIS